MRTIVFYVKAMDSFPTNLLYDDQRRTPPTLRGYYQQWKTKSGKVPGTKSKFRQVRSSRAVPFSGNVAYHMEVFYYPCQGFIHSPSPNPRHPTPIAMWHPSEFLLTGLLLISCCLHLMKMDLFFPPGAQTYHSTHWLPFFQSFTMRFSQIWSFRYRMGWDGMG